MSLFEYVMIPPAIVLGLALTHVLSGFGRVVHRLAGHGPPIRLDWIHLVWVTHVLTWIVFFWWYSYAWTEQFEWRLLIFIFLILYSVLMYLMCVILVPSDLDEVSDFGSYFMSLRSWFFAGLILLILLDYADSAAKGLENLMGLGAHYVVLRTFLTVGAVIAIRTESRRFHCPFALVGFVWTFLFFWLNRPVIGVS